MATEKVVESISKHDVPDPSYGKLVDTYGSEFKVPDYTIKQIRDAIPPHCFERSALRGFAYPARDIFLLTSTFYIFHNYATSEYIRSSTLRLGILPIISTCEDAFLSGGQEEMLPSIFKALWRDFRATYKSHRRSELHHRCCDPPLDFRTRLIFFF